MILALFSILVVITDNDDLSAYGLDDSMWRIPINFAAILLTGLVISELIPRMLVWTRRIFNVQAPLADVRKVVVLALIPIIPVLLLLLLNELMKSGLLPIPFGELGVEGWIMITGAFLLFIPIALAGLALFGWQLSIVSRCLAEVFHDTAWKAFFHLAIVWIILTSAISAIAVPLGLLLHLPG